MSEVFKAHILVIIATILVSGSFLATQKIVSIIDPISLTLFRFLLAILFLSPFIIFSKKRLVNVLQIFPKALIVSLLYTFYFIGMLKSLEYTTVLNTGALYTLVPLMTAVLCIFFFKERITLKQLFIYIIGIVSTSIIVFDANLNLFLELSLNKGDILFLFASFSMALYSVLIKLLYKSDDGLIVLVFATLFGGIFWMSLGMQILNIPYEWNKIDLNHLYYLLYLVVGTTIITLFLYQKATLIIGPKKIMAYTYLNPAIVALIMFIFENETINFGVLLGILISTFATLTILRKK